MLTKIRSLFVAQSADRWKMHFDALVTNPGRLSILTALCLTDRQEFVRLRAATQLTDGNLTTHAHKLAKAGLVEIEKGAKAGRPVTTITLTAQGRAALRQHVNQLTSSVSAIGPRAAEVDPVPAVPSVLFAAEDRDNWID
jgi:DNA-binding MarR family transcriptional regulator